MKVRAKAMGQYNGVMREPGDVFDIDETKEGYDKVPHWMEPLDVPAKTVEQEEVPKKKSIFGKK